MNIKPMGNTKPVIDNSSSFQAEQAAKARAVQAFQKSSLAPAPQAVPQNQSQVTPEEMVMQVPTPNIRQQAQAAREPEIDASSSVEDTTEPSAPQAPAEDTQLSQRFARLARQEKQARIERSKREAEFKAREDALKAREEALKSQPQFDSSKYIEKSKLQQQTLEALAEAEVSYDKIVQDMMNVPQLDPRVQAHMAKLESRIAELTNKLDSQQKSLETQSQTQYQAALNQIKLDASKLVKADPNSYEMIALTGSIPDVVELIEQTFKETGEVLSVEDAAQEVESYLLAEAEKLANAKKIQAKRKAQSVAPAEKNAEQQSQPTQQKQPMKTLNNSIASTRQLSSRDRAILAFSGQLKT